MKKLILLIHSGIISILVYAQNPIVPPGVYIADPSAHVWKDGKLYIYGSLDESTGYYCSHRHHVMATGNLLDWTIYEDRFASKGENDQLPYNDAVLYAPDCQYKDGLYYLYYCQPYRDAAEGVATSENPAGPFTNVQKIDLNGINEIDPSVFIDDDGAAYYMWGQFTAKMAVMKPNMKEIDIHTIKTDVLTEDEHYFHEGGFMAKRNGIYYFIYAHIGRAGMPTCIGYSTSENPMGPYQYGGVIVDNDQCDPGNWNNHGSVVEYKGQWYVFYHRATHNSKMMRKACVEPITFNPDGSIPEVEMTSQGAGGPLNAFSQIDAERACLLFGNVRIQLFEQGNEELGGIYNDDKVAFKYIDFGKSPTKVLVRVSPRESSGKIVMKADMPWHQHIATLEVPEGNGDEEWITLSAPVDQITGIHALWVSFYGGEGEMFGVDWIRFE